MHTLSKEIVDTARQCLGTKFHHQGRLPGVGLDCAGLPIHVAKTLHLPHVDSTGYGMNPTGELESLVSGVALPISPWEVGDILMFWYGEPNKITHLAIATPIGIIHTYRTVRKVVEHRIDEFWEKRFVKAFRFKERTEL
jgi:cell wall-associated NlpC family hydrolase